MTCMLLIGSIVGSFLSVVALRIPKRESIVYPHSRCPQCNERLVAKDLIPIISYLLSRKKCRYCCRSISPFYCIVELVTGVIFLWAYVHFGWSQELLLALLFASLLIVVTATDILYMVIPNVILLFYLLLFLLYRKVVLAEPMKDAYLGSATGFLILLSVGMLFKKIRGEEGIGGGDIKLYAVIGLVLGVEKTILSLFLAASIGLCLFLCIPHIQNKNGEMPFGPSIALAAWLCYLYGHYAIDWYLGFFVS